MMSTKVKLTETEREQQERKDSLNKIEVEVEKWKKMEERRQMQVSEFIWADIRIIGAATFLHENRKLLNTTIPLARRLDVTATEVNTLEAKVRNLTATATAKKSEKDILECLNKLMESSASPSVKDIAKSFRDSVVSKIDGRLETQLQTTQSELQTSKVALKRQVEKTNIVTKQLETVQSDNKTTVDNLIRQSEKSKGSYTKLEKQLKDTITDLRQQNEKSTKDAKDDLKVAERTITGLRQQNEQLKTDLTTESKQLAIEKSRNATLETALGDKTELFKKELEDLRTGKEGAEKEMEKWKKATKLQEDKAAKAERKVVRIQDEVDQAKYNEGNAKHNAEFLREVKNRVMQLLLGVPVPPDYFATVLSSLVDYEPVEADAKELGAQMMVLNYIQNPDMDVDLGLLVSQLPEHYEYVNTIRVVAAKMFQSKEGAAIVMKAALDYPHEFSEWLPEAAYQTPDKAYPPLFTYWSEFWFQVDVGDDTPQQVKTAIADGESKETFIRDLAVKVVGREEDQSRRKTYRRRDKDGCVQV